MAGGDAAVLASATIDVDTALRSHAAQTIEAVAITGAGAVGNARGGGDAAIQRTFMARGAVSIRAAGGARDAVLIDAALALAAGRIAGTLGIRLAVSAAARRLSWAG